MDFSLRNWPHNGSVHQDGKEWGSMFTGATEIKNSFMDILSPNGVKKGTTSESDGQEKVQGGEKWKQKGK